MSREPEEVRIAAARGAMGGHLTKRSQTHSVWEACKVLAFFAQRLVRDGSCFEQRTEVCCGSQQVPLDG